MSETTAAAFITEIQISLARLEGKVDALLQQHGDHEQRIRDLEKRKAVSPWQLWTSLLGGMSALAVTLQVFDFLRGA